MFLYLIWYGFNYCIISSAITETLLKTSSSITEKVVKLLKRNPLITDLGRAGLACLHPSIYPSIHPYIHQSIHPSVHALIHPSIHRQYATFVRSDRVRSDTNVVADISGIWAPTDVIQQIDLRE